MCRTQLESSYFLDNLNHYLKATGFPPHLLSLKFDNDCRFLGIDLIKSIVTRLHGLKVLAIIGDFGSGTDSLGFLYSEPADAVSISRSFTQRIVRDRKAWNMLDHLTRTASDYVNHINIKGIDTPELLESVKDLCVTTMQGNYFTKPLSFDELVEKYYT